MKSSTKLPNLPETIQSFIMNKMFDPPDHVFEVLMLEELGLRMSLKNIFNVLLRVRRSYLGELEGLGDEMTQINSLLEELEDCARTVDVLRDDYVWEHLNIGHWKEVSSTWRRCYTFFSLLKAVFSLLQSKPYKEVVAECDKGLVMGEPIFENILSRIIQDLSHIIIASKQPNEDNSDQLPSLETDLCICLETASLKLQSYEARFDIKSADNPTLEHFLQFMEKQVPLLITNGVEHWPARQKWSINYIQEVAGFRTVPVEIGSKYTSEDWTQKMMTIEEFINTHMSSNCKRDKTKTGYIAQHHLFEQIPNLKDDIRVPDYCSLGKTNDVEINAWFGPGNTVSPMHYDPKHNLLVQVFGTKIIRLYPPSETKYLNPFPATSILFNTSQLDIEDVNLFEIHPEIKNARYCEFLLKPGMTLYMPPKWWHYVKSLTPSFSVSFWFE